MRAPYGSRVGWGLIYERIYVDTIIASATVADSVSTVVSTSARITTEEGVAIVTEDGQTIIEESTESGGSGGTGNVTFGGEPLTFDGQDINQ